MATGTQADGGAAQGAGADIGVYGLGTMGSALALNLADNGFTVAVSNREADWIAPFLDEAGPLAERLIGSERLEDFVAAIARPRSILFMIPSGAPPFDHQSDLAALAKAYKPLGQWQTYEITCVGETLEVKLNGTLITTATSIKNLKGHIGIQAEHGLLEFRKIDLKPMPQSQ